MFLPKTDKSPSKFDKFEMLSGGKVEVIVEFEQSDTNIVFLDETPLKLLQINLKITFAERSTFK